MENIRLTQLNAFLKDEPNDPFLKYAIAQEYLGMEQWEKAKSWFEKVFSDHPDYVPTYYHYGKLLYQTGHENQALAVLQTGQQKAMDAGDRKTANEIAELIDDIE